MALHAAGETGDIDISTLLRVKLAHASEAPINDFFGASYRLIAFIARVTSMKKMMAIMPLL